MSDPADDAPDELERLRARVMSLANQTIDTLVDAIKFGGPADKKAAVSLIAPYLLRTLQATDTDKQLDELRSEVRDMFKELHATDLKEGDPGEPDAGAAPPADPGS